MFGFCSMAELPFADAPILVGPTPPGPVSSFEYFIEIRTFTDRRRI
jgi:hypothetical protein